MLPPEVVAWQFDTFSWLLRNSGGFKEFLATPLVQPTERFFPQQDLSGHELAEAIFLQVKQHARMEDWPCRLEPQEDDPDPVVAPMIVIHGAPSSAAGTFSVSNDAAVISYNPDAVRDPMSLVATFAHELAHFFTGGFPEQPPGGWDNWEFATDLCSVFLGFGIFAANSAFNFSQFSTLDSQGWRSRRVGYLSEAELLHAQAIFSALLAAPPNEVLAHLKGSLRGTYKRACKDIAAQGEQLETLKQI